MFKNLFIVARIPFVRDVTTMQMGRLVTIGCSFLASILYVRFLGLGGYGDYAVVLAYTGTVGLVTNLGQQATTLTFFAEAYGRKDRTAQAMVFNYYIVTSLAAAGLLILLALASPGITGWIYGKNSIGVLAGLVFLSSICELPFIFVSIALQTVREIRLLTILENSKTMTQLFVAVTLSAGLGVTGLLMSSLVAAASSASSPLFFRCAYGDSTDYLLSEKPCISERHHTSGGTRKTDFGSPSIRAWATCTRIFFSSHSAPRSAPPWSDFCALA